MRTPESIAFSYELAGLGSRFLALAIDMGIQIALVAGIFWALVLAAMHSASHPSRVAHNAAGMHAAQSAGVAIIVAVLFLVFFGYFILFEASWNGQTPGKKLLHLRVVRDGGYPADIASSAIRNLIRVGEVVLGFYAVSAIVALASPENKRLGDLAAGTIVVREDRVHALARIVADGDASQQQFSSLLSADEHALVDRYVARRDQLAPEYRSALASQIAGRVRARVSRDLQALDDDELLIRLSGW